MWIISYLICCFCASRSLRKNITIRQRIVRLSMVKNLATYQIYEQATKVPRSTSQRTLLKRFALSPLAAPPSTVRSSTDKRKSAQDWIRTLRTPAVTFRVAATSIPRPQFMWPIAQPKMWVEILIIAKIWSARPPKMWATRCCTDEALWRCRNRLRIPYLRQPLSSARVYRI